MNYKSIYLLAGLLIIGSACEERLEEITPEQALPTDQAFVNELSATSSLIGAYSRMQDLEVFGSMPQVISDYQADNVGFIGSFPTLQDINDYSTLADNGSIENIWRDHYRVVLAANAVITNVPTVDDPTFTEEEKNQLVAEAKFIRAITYFQLVNLFANSYPVADGSNPGVPIILEPFGTEVEFPERATLNEVHSQVETDLTEAIPDLPASLEGRATQGAAQALLSRLHLYRGEWAEAAEFARTVIDGGVYSLAGNYRFYSQNTPEEIFSLQNSEVDNGVTGSGGWSSYYNPAQAGGRGDAPFSSDLLAAYGSEDLRFTELNQVLVSQGGDTTYFTTKFPDGVTNADNVPLIRITEMHLNLAEALAEQDGVNEESLMLINELRERAGLEELTLDAFGSDEEFIAAILDERRKELAFEGHRRMDLLRKGLPLRTEGIGADVANPGDPRTILPIPQREIDVNPSLVQNDGYADD